MASRSETHSLCRYCFCCALLHEPPRTKLQITSTPPGATVELDGAKSPAPLRLKRIFPAATFTKQETSMG